MGTFDLSNPALIISLALVVGLIAQTVAQHLRIPGIVPLLVAGALLGPDCANVIRPSPTAGTNEARNCGRRSPRFPEFHIIASLFAAG